MCRRPTDRACCHQQREDIVEHCARQVAGGSKVSYHRLFYSEIDASVPRSALFADCSTSQIKGPVQGLQYLVIGEWHSRAPFLIAVMLHKNSPLTLSLQGTEDSESCGFTSPEFRIRAVRPVPYPTASCHRKAGRVVGYFELDCIKRPRFFIFQRADSGCCPRPQAGASSMR